MITVTGLYNLKNEHWDFDFIIDITECNKDGNFAYYVIDMRQSSNSAFLLFGYCTDASDMYQHSKILEKFPETFSLRESHPEAFI